MPAQTATKTVAADWQTKQGDELAETLGVVFRMVRDENEWRTDKDEYHWGLYEGTGDGGVTLKSRRNLTYMNATLPDNVCKMGVDTLTSKVAALRPIPQVLTAKGNYKDQRRARKIRQMIQGEFHRQHVHEKLAPIIIKDALVARAGAVFIGRDGKKPKIERVHIWTLFTDDWDAEFGSPRTLFRLRTMDKRAAVKRFGKTPELKRKIEDAGYFSNNTRHWIRDEDRSSTVERVELLEAWYRCCDHDEEDDKHECDGRHVIICDGAVLFDEVWEHDYFPFAILTYDTPNTGFWGSGMVQTLEGYQVNIDKANEKLDKMYDLSGKLVLLRDGSGVFKSDLVDDIRVAHVRPGPYEPVVVDLDLVNEHMRMRAPELVERALNAVGVSQMSAQSKKPAGVDAAVALQTLDDIESQRHVVFGHRFQSWCMDVARRLIDVVKEIAEEYGDYEVKVPLSKRGAFLPLKWKDVVVDGFQLEMQSVGQLFTSFAGRIEQLKALFEMGQIDGYTFIRNLDTGDLQSEIEQQLAPRILVDEIIEAMLDFDGRPANDNVDADGYIAPTEYMPLDWASERAHLRRTQAELDGAPEYVLKLLTRFIEDIQYIQNPKQAKAMTPEGGAIDPNAAPVPPAGPVPPVPPGGGMPVDPMMMPMATTPGGDQLMQPPPGAVPPIAA